VLFILLLLYPSWPALIPTILSHIQVQNIDVLRMYNSLLALRKVAKRYEYKSKGERKPLNDIVQVSFPHLQQLMTVVVSHNSLEAAQVMKLCLKIFWSATMYQLPEVSGVDVNFWFSMIAQVLDKPLPEASEGLEPAGQPVDPEERTAWPWWKVSRSLCLCLCLCLLLCIKYTNMHMRL
jgi:importin-7